MLGASGLCLDVRGRAASDGAPVQLASCDHARPQLVHSDGAAC